MVADDKGLAAELAGMRQLLRQGLEAINSRLDDLNTRIDRLSSSTMHLQQGVHDNHIGVVELRTSQQALSQRLEALEVTHDDTRDDGVELSRRVVGVEAWAKDYKSMRNRIMLAGLFTGGGGAGVGYVLSKLVEVL